MVPTRAPEFSAAFHMARLWAVNRAKRTTIMARFFVTLQGRLRSGSMPPPSLRARAGSLPPGMRSGSVTPAARATSAVYHVAAAGGHGGIVKHRAMTTNVVHGVRSDGTTGVVAVPPRSSHAAASSAHRRRASISVVPGTAAAATAAAAAAARRKDNQQPIVRWLTHGWLCCV